MGYLGQDRLGPLNLLIPRRDLTQLPVKENEPSGEIEQAIRPQQADDQPVLLCGPHRAAVEPVEVVLHPLGLVGKKLRSLSF